MVAGRRFYVRVLFARGFVFRNSQQAKRPGGPGNQYYTVNQLSFGFAAVLAVKAFDSSRGVNQLLFAREKRVTAGTYFEPDLGLRRARLPRLTASAVNGGGNVFRMNVRLHFASHSCCEFFYLSNMRGYPMCQAHVKVLGLTGVAHAASLRSDVLS